jgi:hypothetical protein
MFSKEELFTIIQEIKDLGSYRRQLAEAKKAAAGQPTTESAPQDEVLDG